MKSRIAFVILMSIAIFIVIIITTRPSINDKMLSYAEKKYEKQFDIILARKGIYGLNGKHPDYLYLTNKDETFTFHVKIHNKEFSDDYMNTYIGSDIAGKVADSLGNRFSYINKYTYIGYLYSVDISSYVNNQYPIIYTDDGLSIAIVFTCSDPINDEEFFEIVQYAYQTSYSYSMYYTLQILCVQTDNFDTALYRLKHSDNTAAIVLSPWFKDILAYYFCSYFSPEYLLETKNIKDFIEKY